MSASAPEPGCWVGTSWKMNKTLAEALAFADALAEVLPRVDGRIQPFLVPPFTVAREVRRRLDGTRVKVGAQNMHWAEAGAWTGEISAAMLADCGLDLVELGHSERRAHFAETDDAVGLKAAAALRHGLIPLICVGETQAERQAGRSDDVLARQVRGALAGIGKGTTSVLFAYEPVWAIGESGIPAAPDYADERQRRIKAVAAEMLGGAPQVLYGGSVTPGNAAELVGQPHVDGLFIGRAAWQAEGYADILARVGLALAADARLPSPA